MGLSLAKRESTVSKDPHSTRVDHGDLELAVSFLRALMLVIPVSLLLWGCVLWGMF